MSAHRSLPHARLNSTVNTPGFMTTEQRAQIQTAIRKTPKTVWAYWPFLIPVLAVVVGVAVQIMLIAYFKSKIPGLEVLFKRGTRIEPVWDSQLIREAVLATALSITGAFMLFIFLARLAFRYATLLKAVAKDAGIDES